MFGRVAFVAAAAGLVVAAGSGCRQTPPPPSSSTSAPPASPAAAVTSQGAFGCSGADRGRVAAYTTRATEALMQGDAARYVLLERELDTSLSPGCRSELAVTRPALAACSSEERSLTLSTIARTMEAAQTGDVVGALALYGGLEEDLSESCWLAVNRHVDKTVVNTCTTEELDFMASRASSVIRAFNAVLQGDIGPVTTLQQEVGENVSTTCLAAVQSLQRRQPPLSQGQNAPVRPASVYDHGGGTYSMPGVGACTPTGCMAF